MAYFFSLACFILLLGGLGGCKKEGANTAFSRIQGRWRLIEFGIDNNGDGVIEPYELQLLSSKTITIYDFKGDSTGMQSTVANGDTQFNINFYWKLLGDSLWIATSIHDTTTYYVSLLNSSNLIILANLPVTVSSGNSTILTENYFNKD